MKQRSERHAEAGAVSDDLDPPVRASDLEPDAAVAPLMHTARQLHKQRNHDEGTPFDLDLARLELAQLAHLVEQAREAGALRFRERIVVCDSSRFDTLLAIPL